MMKSEYRHDRKHVYRFIKFLEGQKGPSGKANLAELRRGAANPLQDYRSIWILGPYLPDTNGWAFDAYRLVATLYAMHKQEKATGQDISFAVSLGRLRKQLSVGQESMDKRFSALLDTHREDLAVPLRNFVQRISNAKTAVPVDYAKLLWDLLHWDYDSTRRKWARDYWRPQPIEEETENND